MALPLLRLTERVALVNVYDDAVTETDPPELPDDAEDFTVAAHGMRWIERHKATVADGATVVTVRPLGKVDQVRLQMDRTGAEWLIQAAQVATVSVEGDGLTGDAATRLSRLPVALTLSLGRWVWAESTAIIDPTSASLSE